jgi:hypothetical protein
MLMRRTKRFRLRLALTTSPSYCLSPSLPQSCQALAEARAAREEATKQQLEREQKKAEQKERIRMRQLQNKEKRAVPSENAAELEHRRQKLAALQKKQEGRGQKKD